MPSAASVTGHNFFNKSDRTEESIRSEIAEFEDKITKLRVAAEAIASTPKEKMEDALKDLWHSHIARVEFFAARSSLPNTPAAKELDAKRDELGEVWYEYVKKYGVSVSDMGGWVYSMLIAGGFG